MDPEGVSLSTKTVYGSSGGRAMNRTDAGAAIKDSGVPLRGHAASTARGRASAGVQLDVGGPTGVGMERLTSRRADALEPTRWSIALVRIDEGSSACDAGNGVRGPAPNCAAKRVGPPGRAPGEVDLLDEPLCAE